MTIWNNKVVVVTGGSCGLGREIAVAFARRGARVVVIARNEVQMQSVVEELTRENSMRIESIGADVTDPQQVQLAVAQTIKRLGAIDVWVNNVGRSIRASVNDTDIDAYRELMETNFYSAVHCTNAVLEHLKQSKGSLINIGSLVSKTAWPFMAPYSASKHALTAFTHQLRIEGPKEVHYLMVCPGPILRDSNEQRYADQTENLPDTAQLPGGGARISGIAPDKLAERIIRACARRKHELVVPWTARILFSLSQLSPALGDFLLRRFNK